MKWAIQTIKPSGKYLKKSPDYLLWITNRSIIAKLFWFKMSKFSQPFLQLREGLTNQKANGQKGRFYKYGHCDCLWIYSPGSLEFICFTTLSQNNLYYYYSGHSIYFNWYYYSDNKSDSKCRGMTNIAYS